ncbi:hypothetical protein MnTg02_00567 [bacterium MnTg02]|nr:hypothetical protein MnTg02_00567 [bacterium MnTg02]
MRPSLAATITLQPVPQKRQGAFDHFNSVVWLAVGNWAASAEPGMPAAAAAAATALALI